MRNSLSQEDFVSPHMPLGNAEDHPTTDQDGTEIHQLFPSNVEDLPKTDDDGTKICQPSPGHEDEHPTTEQDDTEIRQLFPASESDEDELTTLPHEYHELSSIPEECEDRATPASPSPPEKQNPTLPKLSNGNFTSPVIHLKVALEIIKPDGCRIVGSDSRTTKPLYQEERMLWFTLHCQDHWSFLMFDLEMATIATYSPLSLRNDVTHDALDMVISHVEKQERFQKLAWGIDDEYYNLRINELDSSVYAFIGALYSVAKLPVPSEIDDVAWKLLFRCFFDNNSHSAQPDNKKGFTPLLPATDARDLDFVVISTDIEARSNDLAQAEAQAHQAQEQIEIVKITADVIIPQRIRSQVAIQEQIQQNEAERDALIAMKETLINNSAIIATRIRIKAEIENSVNEIVASLVRLHHELEDVMEVIRRWCFAQSLARKLEEAAKEKFKISERALKECVKRSEEHLEVQRAAMTKATNLVEKARGYLEDINGK